MDLGFSDEITGSIQEQATAAAAIAMPTTVAPTASAHETDPGGQVATLRLLGVDWWTPPTAHSLCSCLPSILVRGLLSLRNLGRVISSLPTSQKERG